MLIVTVFRLFACALCLKSQKMDITIGAKEAYLSENGMMNSLQNGLKMLLKTTGAFTEVPRLHAELKEQGVHCGRKRIVRLMQALTDKCKEKEKESA